MKVLMAAAVLVAYVSLMSFAADVQPRPDELAAVKQVLASTDDARKKGDMAAIVAFWTKDGDFGSLDGRVTTASEMANATMPPSPNMAPRTIERIRFLTSDVAFVDSVLKPWITDRGASSAP
jgi:hypothetical protein